MDNLTAGLSGCNKTSRKKLVPFIFLKIVRFSMFMGIIVINTVIGIIQEVRAKKTLDKLAILTESKAVVLREGKKWSISLTICL